MDLIPILGQPGLFTDSDTGQIVNIRDFRESTPLWPPPREMKWLDKYRKHLSTQTYNAIRRHPEVRSLKQLSKLSVADVRRWDRFGAKALAEVQALLRKHKLKLRGGS